MKIRKGKKIRNQFGKIDVPEENNKQKKDYVGAKWYNAYHI